MNSHGLKAATRSAALNSGRAISDGKGAGNVGFANTSEALLICLRVRKDKMLCGSVLAVYFGSVGI